MIAREAGRVHRELRWACPWRRPFQQTQVELSRGFGAMGKVISRMAAREPGRSNAQTGMAPDEAGDNWETAEAEAKVARPTGRGQTSPLRRAARKELGGVSRVMMCLVFERWRWQWSRERLSMDRPPQAGQTSRSIPVSLRNRSRHVDGASGSRARGSRRRSINTAGRSQAWC